MQNQKGNDNLCNIEDYKKRSIIAVPNVTFENNITKKTKTEKISESFDDITIEFSYKNKNHRVIQRKKRRAINYSFYNKINKKALSIACSLAVLIVLISMLSFNFKIGYEVFIDGKSMGVVADKAKFYSLYSGLENELRTHIQNQSLKKPKLSLRFYNKNSATNEILLKYNILSTVNALVEGYAIVVDGKNVVALQDEAAAKAVLESLKAPYLSGNLETLEFDKPVSILKSFVPVSIFMNQNDATRYLMGVSYSKSQYVVEQNDTFWSISKKYNISPEKIAELNPGINPSKIKLGQTLNVLEPKPILNVKTVKNVEYENQIAYNTKRIEDNGIYKGRTTVVQDGNEGKSKVLAKVYCLNGKEIERKILQETVLSNPTEKIIKIGTKNPPPSVGTGVFTRPYYGYISSRFGSRWHEMHTGVDLAGNIGDPIVAADNGVVAAAGYSGGYGNLIIINHSNGFTTYYGHCSKISVKVGQKVAKGEVIGKVGSTGRSTGPHLHFEVRKNGIPQNPLKYIN